MNKNTKKKTTNRFNGLTEEEVQKNTLQDYLEHDLDIVILGINPSLMAAHKGRYYAGPGNHFYKLLHAAELVPRFVNFEEDKNLLEYKIGLTNIVERATRSSADLTSDELKKGCNVVVEKMKIYKPKIIVFNGKCIYQPFSQKLGIKQFNFGLQSVKIGESAVWVVPSSSARCSNFPRMEDKLHFYKAIKKHLQFIKGEIENVNLNEFIFENKVRHIESKMWKKTNNKNNKITINKCDNLDDSSDDNIAAFDSNEFVITEILEPSLPSFGASTTSVNNIQEIITVDKSKNSSKESLEVNTKQKHSPKPATHTTKEKINLKRTWTKPEGPGDNMNYLNLIKQRLTEKNNINNNNNQEIPEKLKKIKKLNFSNLNSLNK